MLIHLLKNKLLILVYHFRNLNTSFVKGKLLRYFILLLVPYWFYISTYKMFSSWFMVPGFNFDIILNFVSFTITGLFFLLTISGITLSLHYNFLSSDLPLLLSLPIKKSVLFSNKFFEIVFSNSMLYILIGLPVIIAALVVFKISLLPFSLIICISLVFLAVPSGLASLISIALAIILPVKRTRNLTSIIMGVFFIVIWGGLQFFKLSRLDPYSTDFDNILFNQLAETDATYSSFLLPSNWLVNIIKGFVQGNVGIILISFALLVSVSLLLLQVSSWFLCRIYTKDFVPVLNQPIQKNSKTAGNKNVSTVRVNRFHILVAIMKRDLKCLLRDSRFVTLIFFYAGLFIVLPFVFQIPVPNINETFILYQPFINLAFASSLMAGGLTSRLIPLEKYSFSYTKILPQPTRGYIFSKIFTGFSLTLAASLIGLLINFMNKQIPVYIVLNILLLNIFNILGSTSIGLFAGSVFANFDWENPRQMLNETGNITLNIIVMLYMIFGIIIFAVVLILYHTFLAIMVYIFYSLICSFIS
ncbi:hypothetical protein JXQ31_20625, partial [candidate division KSB1 bacterium]|nr:hypothetical protein [candidate division KSB1 bacterium]